MFVGSAKHLTWDRRRPACKPRWRPIRDLAGGTPAVPGSNGITTNTNYGLIAAGGTGPLAVAAGVVGAAALGERCVGASGVLFSGNCPLYFRASSIRSVPSLPSLLIRMPS